ncbi:hypothetical protein LEP1GSC051_3159 [Leptospira sp. P2653]|nr:hypothetical protein LEP1GSC051_3159 [Leptospira sp. P2653]EMN42519.1 hypothetical protein LEP1GSC086_1385 [Leptospira weilii str. LNT 1234]
MCDVTPTVLVYADLHEFEGEFPEIYKIVLASGNRNSGFLFPEIL